MTDIIIQHCPSRETAVISGERKRQNRNGTISSHSDLKRTFCGCSAITIGYNWWLTGIWCLWRLYCHCRLFMHDIWIAPHPQPPPSVRAPPGTRWAVLLSDLKPVYAVGVQRALRIALTVVVSSVNLGHRSRWARHWHHRILYAKKRGYPSGFLKCWPLTATYFTRSIYNPWVPHQ